MTSVAVEPSANTLAVRRYKARNKQRIKETRNRAREWELVSRKRRDFSTWPKINLPHLRHRAKEKGIPFDLCAEDIVVPSACPVLGIPLMAGGESPKANRPSVDRIDNTKGYTRDNIRVISLRANSLKSDASVDEIRAILNYMESAL